MISNRIAIAMLLLASMSAGCRTSSQVPPIPPANTVLAAHSDFDGATAYSYLVDQCQLGPRKPGTVGHARGLQYIEKILKPNVDVMSEQRFDFYDPDRRVLLHLTNVIGVINPTAKRKVMLFTHWDTRPTADQELDPGPQSQPIIGADDGASGTAVLLECARVFHEKRPDVGVVLLFVDGEDWGPKDDKMYLGAKFFARHPGAARPDYAILLDMIGDKNVQVHREFTSEKLHPEINQKIWQAADDLGYSSHFPPDVKYQIGDDHDSFNDAGIPAVDLIDFDYPYWHTLQDTADKCSADSLKVIGDVMAKVIYKEPSK